MTDAVETIDDVDDDADDNAPAELPVQRQRQPQFKREQAELVRAFGARMREAREMCNLSQTAAARRLGYANSTKLAKVENASDTNSVPLWLIVRAANLYDVSVDFLVGATEGFERDPMERDAISIHRWLLAEREKQAARELAVLYQVGGALTELSNLTEKLSSAVDEMLTAVLRFWERNREFEDMPASSTVVGALERSEALAREARTKLSLVRAKMERQMNKWGGNRPGSGRKPGAKNLHATVKLQRQAIKHGAEAVDLLAQVMGDESQPIDARIASAGVLLQVGFAPACDTQTTDVQRLLNGRSTTPKRDEDVQPTD